MRNVFLIAVMFLSGTSWAAEKADIPQPRGRNCQQRLLNGLFEEPKDEKTGYQNSFEDEREPGANDWDGSHPNNSARDPGGF